MADWLFALKLLGIGLTLAAGGAAPGCFRGDGDDGAEVVSEVAPLAKHLTAASMSTNMFADYHLVYAAVMFARAVVSVW